MAACACTAASFRTRNCRAFEAIRGEDPRRRRPRHAASPARRRDQGLLRQCAARRSARYARVRRHRQLRAYRARGDGALRHVAPRARKDSRGKEPVPALRAAAFRRAGHARRLRRCGAFRPAPRLGGRAARFRARRESHRRARPAARLRRPGDEERRRLRRGARDGGLARHAGADRGSLAQGAAAAGGGEDAAFRALPACRARTHERMGGAAAADLGHRMGRRGAHYPALRRRARGQRGGGQAWRRGAVGRGGAQVLARAARAGASVLRRPRAALARFGFAGDRPAAAAGTTAPRMAWRRARHQSRTPWPQYTNCATAGASRPPA